MFSKRKKPLHLASHFQPHFQLYIMHILYMYDIHKNMNSRKHCQKGQIYLSSSHLRKINSQVQFGFLFRNKIRRRRLFSILVMQTICIISNLRKSTLGKRLTETWASEILWNPEIYAPPGLGSVSNEARLRRDVVR